MEATAQLDAIACEAANECFVDSYKTDENLEDRKDNGLGIRIAQYTQWDGDQIMRIFMYALEDANFHGQAAIVQGWLPPSQQDEGDADAEV